MVNLQHDVGKWSTEYTWSAEDSMWGVRVLHNFGKLGAYADSSEDNEKASPTLESPVGVKRVDEEDAVEGGLKGRVSVGAEVYLSAKERSAGGQFPYSKFNLDLIVPFSIDWYSIHDFPGRYSSVVSNTKFIIFVVGRLQMSTLATSNDYYGSIQSNARTYVRRILRSCITRPLSFVAF